MSAGRIRYSTSVIIPQSTPCQNFKQDGEGRRVDKVNHASYCRLSLCLLSLVVGSLSFVVF
jgi:hypothetical protein